MSGRFASTSVKRRTTLLQSSLEARGSGKVWSGESCLLTGKGDNEDRTGSEPVKTLVDLRGLSSSSLSDESASSFLGRLSGSLVDGFEVTAAATAFVAECVA